MRETVDFKAMMGNLMVKSVNKKSDFITCSKIEPMYKITSLGFERMQIKSFFKPTRSNKKC